MKKQIGTIRVDKIYAKYLDVIHMTEVEIPLVSENDSLASYFDRILAAVGIKPEPSLKRVVVHMFFSGHLVVLHADASAINDSTTSPATVLFVTEDRWVGIYARAMEARASVSLESNPQKLRLLHGAKAIGGLQNVAGQVVSLPKKFLVDDSDVMILETIMDERIRATLNFISPSGPIPSHLITPETIAKATVISNWTDASVMEGQEERALITAKEIGEAAWAIRGIDKKARARRQVVGAVGKVAKSLYPAADLRGVFQIHHTDYGAVLQIMGGENGTMVDLRFSEPGKVGLFVSGKGVIQNRDFFEHVADYMHQPLLLYDPESGNSLFFERHREIGQVCEQKQKNHAIPISDVFACVAFYKLGAQRRKLRTP